MKEVLYNGITLPEQWPPRRQWSDMESDGSPLEAPYLKPENIPPVIPIDVGRQLFVDHFLIEDTDLTSVYHKAKKFEGNPVLTAETRLERGNNGDLSAPYAAPKSGGVWWDRKERIFRMWYEAGWLHALAYATSEDGIHWNRPGLGFEWIKDPSNRIIPWIRPDSTTFWLNDTDEEFRCKMFLRGPGGDGAGMVAQSRDGIHWQDFRTTAASMGDRTTIFYNPFRKKWVYSLRCSDARFSRAREYRECDDLIAQSVWDVEEQVPWLRTDRLDQPDPEIQAPPQLYNADCVAYESIMLGLFEIHRGPENQLICEKGIPKITELIPMYSRDGFHFTRPSREAFISASRKAGTWDRGYVQSVGGVCLIVGDELWFYYSGTAGDESNHIGACALSGMYANGSTGIARLRRDGFVSLHTCKSGQVTTRRVSFSGKYLFVNVSGSVTAEVLNENGDVIPGFSAAECRTVHADSTKLQLVWRDKNSLAGLENRPVRFRFYLENGDLYAFWVSRKPTGESGGYPAAGEVVF